MIEIENVYFSFMGQEFNILECISGRCSQEDYDKRGLLLFLRYLENN